MANAKCCDRCGKYYFKYQAIEGLAAIVFLNSNDVQTGKKDLCPSCAKRLKDWLYGDMSMVPYSEEYEKDDSE